MYKQCQQNIDELRREIGWADVDFNLDNKEALKPLNEQYRSLLNSLEGKTQTEFKGSKIYTGTLSPGCYFCGQSHWSCIFLNRLCTASCFFCPQDRNCTKEHAPRLFELGLISNPDLYASFLSEYREWEEVRSGFSNVNCNLDGMSSNHCQCG